MASGLSRKPKLRNGVVALADIPSAHYRQLRGAAMQMWSEIAHL